MCSWWYELGTTIKGQSAASCGWRLMHASMADAVVLRFENNMLTPATTREVSQMQQCGVGGGWMQSKEASMSPCMVLAAWHWVRSATRRREGPVATKLSSPIQQA